MEKIEEKKRKFEIPGVRYLFAVNGLLGFLVVYALRVNISVAIVAMVNQTAIVETSTNNLSSKECVVPSSSNDFSNSTNDSNTKDGEFMWSSKMQGVVLGSFYYGYVISQIPGGRLAELYSGKWVFGISTLITSVLTLLTPIAARAGVGYLIAVRAIEGFAQGVAFPAMNFMVGQWAPDSEKAVLNTLVHAGVNIGSLVAMSLSAYLCDSDWLGGWPASFYVTGMLGCAWFILWVLLVTDSPLTHPLISEKEIKYITSNQKMDLRKEIPPIPWKKILTSIPFWAAVITITCQNWSFYTMMTDLPTFFSTILHFPMAENGFFSSFPHVLQTLVGLIVSAVGDSLIRKNIFSMNFVRKFCNSVSGFGTVLGLIGVCLSGCDVTMNKIFFIFSIAIGGFAYNGQNLTLLDMSPEYAGTLLGITNTIANLTGFITPLVVGALTEGKNTLHQWRIAFGITASLLAFASFVFIFFSTSDKQDWADQEPSSDVISHLPKETADQRKKYTPMN
ncbi:Sialin [Araneus ventricosus]|uniref:Sialin n=1 Tax=Araneus ventricosus TaxID=182803 RepID=A0A4Y2P8Y1_ARAVE|nr:Sialin [Araneus ventricosus]GBN48398.1 Sialin [Araneus ventricosus]